MCNNNIKYILTRTIFSLICILTTNMCFAQTLNEHIIQVTGEAQAFIENKTSVVKIQVEANGSSAAQTDKQIEAEISRVVKSKSSTLIIHRTDYFGATSDPSKLVKGSPIRAVTTASIVSNDGTTGTLIDQLLNQQNIKIISVSTRASNKSEAILAAYTTAVQNARVKAENIAKENALTLGNILEISVNEEPPPSSIRDQLQNNPEQVDSGSEELKIFANVKFEIKSISKIVDENKLN